MSIAMSVRRSLATPKLEAPRVEVHEERPSRDADAVAIDREAFS